MEEASWSRCQWLNASYWQQRGSQAYMCELACVCAWRKYVIWPCEGWASVTWVGVPVKGIENFFNLSPLPHSSHIGNEVGGLKYTCTVRMIWKTALHYARFWLALALVSGQLTVEEKEQILDLHNWYRSMVSPEAADMLHMVSTECTWSNLSTNFTCLAHYGFYVHYNIWIIAS